MNHWAAWRPFAYNYKDFRGNRYLIGEYFPHPFPTRYSKLCSNRDQNECKDGEDLKCDSDFCGKDSNDKCAIPLPDKDQIVELFFKHRYSVWTHAGEKSDTEEKPYPR